MSAMAKNNRRLRFAYAGNIVGAGIPGAVMIALPEWARANMFEGTQDPAIFGIAGSIWLAIGLGSLIGLRYPNALKGIFLVQVIYKAIWILTVAIPLMIQGDNSVLPMAIFFALVVVAFGYVLFEDRWLAASTLLKPYRI